jgi:LacI family transcriptional regulator
MPRKQAKITSKHVAQRAGVSQTTVSFVLNQVENSNISDETRQRVLDAVRELDYVPDVTARALARGRSSNIALILVNPHRQVFIDEYFPAILTGLNEVMQQHGYRILVQLLSDAAHIDVYTRLIRGKEVAGAIINLNPEMPDDIDLLLPYVRDHFPLVTLESAHPEIPSVTVDKLEGTRQIVRHLVRLGHRRIACISYAPIEHTHVLDRLNVYRSVLAEAGIPYDDALFRVGAYDPETGYRAMKSLLESERFTALYAMNDVMAFGAMAAIQEAGLRVPEDIAVVGFDDIRLARYASPALTTVHEPNIEHGRRAGELLIDLINGVDPPENHINLATRLVVRRSCGAPTP